MRAAILLATAILLLSACAPTQEPLPGPVAQPELSAPVPASPGAPESTPAPPATMLPGIQLLKSSSTPANQQPSMETLLADPAVEAVVQKAKEMLADKLGIEPETIQLFHLQARDWPDESLGCPITGQNYAQGITPGYLIELDAGGPVYVFHSDQGTMVRLCGIEPTREIYQPP